MLRRQQRLNTGNPRSHPAAAAGMLQERPELGATQVVACQEEGREVEEDRDSQAGRHFPS